MGMYTGLRGTITIKDEYIKNISSMVEDGDWNTSFPVGLSLEMDKWLCVRRRVFIPFGAICYLDWENQPVTMSDDGVLSFACSLKNYEGEIQTFLDMLPTIATEWELESLYEECEIPTKHTNVKPINVTQTLI